jgi:peptide/nickel transport system ATP-binding protein
MSFIKAQNLTRHYDLSNPWIVRKLTGQPQHLLTAVNDVSFSVEKGTTYGLVGESGSGKSTIAKMAVGLLKPSAGSIRLDGYDLNLEGQSRKDNQAMRRRIQMVFQSPYASLNPRWKVGDILAEPIRSFELIQGATNINKRVSELLEQVGLSRSDANKYPHEFSGGQRQRISIARALSSQPEVIICDEPTSALDVSVQAQVLNLLMALQKEFSLTYLFITHDLAVVSSIANRIGVLNKGALVEEGTVKELFENPKQDYTRMLLQSAPKMF